MRQHRKPLPTAPASPRTAVQQRIALGLDALALFLLVPPHRAAHADMRPATGASQKAKEKLRRTSPRPSLMDQR